MAPDPPRRPGSRRVLGTQLLLLGSLLALAGGHFIQLNDTSGSGYQREIDWLALPAVGLAIAAVAVAVRAVASCRRLGATLLVLVVLIGAQMSSNTGFRFGWHGDEDELFVLELVLLLTGLAMLVLPSTDTGGSTRPVLRQGILTRLLGYLLIGVVSVIAAFALGTALGEHAQPASCDDCDLAPLEGLFFDVVMLPVLTAGFLLNEVRIVVRRRRRLPRGPAPAAPPTARGS